MTERRTSAAPAPIPPAPPPPPPKQTNKQRSYFERFVAQPLTTAYASRPSSGVQATRPDGGPPNPLIPKLTGYVGILLVAPTLIYFILISHDLAAVITAAAVVSAHHVLSPLAVLHCVVLLWSMVAPSPVSHRACLRFPIPIPIL